MILFLFYLLKRVLVIIEGMTQIHKWLHNYTKFKTNNIMVMITYFNVNKKILKNCVTEFFSVYIK